MEEVQKAFDRLTQSNNFSCIDNEDLKIVALAIWHSGFIPIVNDSISSIPVAGYVIDKLRRFSCVPQEAKCELTALTRILKSSLESDAEQKNLATNKRLDPLAIEWGLESDLKIEVRRLLKYQSRSYRPVEHDAPN